MDHDDSGSVPRRRVRRPFQPSSPVSNGAVSYSYGLCGATHSECWQSEGPPTYHEVAAQGGMGRTMANGAHSVRHRTDNAVARAHARTVISDTVTGGSRSAPIKRFALPRSRLLCERHPRAM